MFRDVVGFFYPAYCTLKLIESRSKGDKIQWMTYWLIFGGFSVAESFTPTICYFFPNYFVIKFFFILWLICPVLNVSSFRLVNAHSP